MTVLAGILAGMVAGCSNMSVGVGMGVGSGRSSVGVGVGNVGAILSARTRVAGRNYPHTMTANLIRNNGEDLRAQAGFKDTVTNGLPMIGC